MGNLVEPLLDIGDSEKLAEADMHPATESLRRLLLGALGIEAERVPFSFRRRQFSAKVNGSAARR
jgi:hypothetical protein